MPLPFEIRLGRNSNATTCHWKALVAAASKKMLTLEEQSEQAHRMARLASFRNGREVAARQRQAELREKKRGGDRGYGEPLTRAEEATFRYLAVLYPPPPPPGPPQEALDQHPFRELLDL